MSHDKKISLIGAGNIGTILAFSISRKRLGNITLVDRVKGLAEGKCLDLSQSLSAENLNTKILGTDDISRIKNSHAIVITAGIPRKPGMSRDDLVETNFSIMKELGNAIKKYSANAFLAMKISFINQISRLSDKQNANIHDIRKGLGLDARINPHFLYSGLGYGGSCFPKDVKALTNLTDHSILKQLIETNEELKKR